MKHVEILYNEVVLPEIYADLIVSHELGQSIRSNKMNVNDLLKSGQILERTVTIKSNGYFADKTLYYKVLTISEPNTDETTFTFCRMFEDNNGFLVADDYKVCEGIVSVFIGLSGKPQVYLGYYPIDALSYSYNLSISEKVWDGTPLKENHLD